MTTPERDKMLALFVAAADAPPPPPGESHPADDDETVAQFATDALTATARRLLLAHLAACTHCRTRFAEFARDGTLAALRGTAPPPAAVARPLLKSNRRAVLGGLLAACVLFGGFGLWWVQSEPARGLAKANAALDAGRTSDALADLERVPTARLTAADRRRHAELVERAAYTLGRDALANRRFDDVAEYERRAAAGGGTSGRLTNLTVQASRGQPDETGLTASASLLDRGVLIDGRQVRVRGAAQNPELEGRFRQALAAFPDDPALLTNYGEFLTDKVRYEDAVEVLTRAVAAAPDNPAAHTGLGLVLFKTDRPKDALPHFREAERLGYGLAAVNAALCHEALGERAEARACWERALPLVDADLKKRIAARLAE